MSRRKRIKYLITHTGWIPNHVDSEFNRANMLNINFLNQEILNGLKDFGFDGEFVYVVDNYASLYAYDKENKPIHIYQVHFSDNIMPEPGCKTFKALV